MLTKFNDVWRLLETKEKNLSLLYFILGLVIAALEVSSLGSLEPLLRKIATTSSSENILSNIKWTLPAKLDNFNPIEILSFIFILLGLKFLLSVMSNHLLVRLISGFQSGLGKKLYSNILDMGLSDAEKIEKIKINRLIEDAEKLSVNILTNFFVFFHNLTLVFGILLLTSFYSVEFFLYIVATLILLFIFYITAFKNIYLRLGQERLEHKRKIMRLVTILKDNLVEIEAFKYKETLRRDFNNSCVNLAEVNRKKKIINLNSKPIFEIISTSILFLIAFYTLDDGGNNRIGFINISIAGVILIRLVPYFARAFTAMNAIMFSKPYVNEVNQYKQIKTFRPELKQSDVHEIEANKLCYRYTEKSVTKKFSFTIKKNGVYLIHGGNGTGKSTLLKLLTTLFSPTSGKLILNRDYDFQKHYNPTFTYLSQEPLLFPGSIQENVQMNTFFDEKIYKHVYKAFNLFQLEEKCPQVELYGEELSGGEKKLVALARALCTKHKLILLDEPFSFLEQNYHNSIIQVLDKLRNEKIIIITSHLKFESQMYDEVFTYED